MLNTVSEVLGRSTWNKKKQTEKLQQYLDAEGCVIISYHGELEEVRNEIKK